MKMKLRKSLTLFNSMTFIVLLLVFSLITLLATKKIMIDNSLETLDTITKTFEITVSERLAYRLNILKSIALDQKDELKEHTLTEIGKQLEGYARTNDFIEIYMLDRQGDTTTQNKLLQELSLGNAKLYFEKAFKGEEVISSPMYLSDKKTFVILYIVPVEENNEVEKLIIGIVDGIKPSQMVSTLSFYETGEVFIIDETGVLIGDKDTTAVFAQKRYEEENKSLYFFGETTYKAYTQMKNGWVIGSSVEKKDILKRFNAMRVLTLLSIGIATCVIILASYKIAKKIGKRIEKLEEIIRHFNAKDFTYENPYKESKIEDEITQINEAVEESKTFLSKMIYEFKTMIKQLILYCKKLIGAADDMQQIAQDMNHSMKEVAKANLLHANDITEVTELTGGFKISLNHATKDIKEVDGLCEKINEKAIKSNEAMTVTSQNLKAFKHHFTSFGSSIKRLNNTIESVEEISNMITKITDQTHLLALNATIEAARAGDAGRGFAVVAGAIGKLAEESQSFSTQIAHIIKEVSLENQTLIVDSKEMEEKLTVQVDEIKETLQSFEDIIEAVSVITIRMNSVTYATQSIESKIGEITERVENSSSISEQIAATTQEVVALTEQLREHTHTVMAIGKKLQVEVVELLKTTKVYKLKNDREEVEE